MKFRFELYGIITRDIMWIECEADSLKEAEKQFKDANPCYRLNRGFKWGCDCEVGECECKSPWVEIKII